ncbi:hypothetical protein PT2222_270048 [Paraburkholderia tropica]
MSSLAAVVERGEASGGVPSVDAERAGPAMMAPAYL